MNETKQIVSCDGCGKEVYESFLHSTNSMQLCPNCIYIYNEGFKDGRCIEKGGHKMAMTFNEVFNDPEYQRCGFNGKCPHCGSKVIVEKSIEPPTTPGTSRRDVARCMNKMCGKVLRVTDGNDDIVSRNDDFMGSK